MPRRGRRVKRRTQGKEPRVMTRSFITSSTPGGINKVIVVEPTQTTGATATDNVFDGADTSHECSPNSIIKYFNIRLQEAIKTDESTQRPGWIEYGLVQFDNQGVEPSIPANITSNVGTQTLPELLRNNYRNHCIWTGAFGLSAETPGVLDLKIKIPDKFCKNQVGIFWVFYYMFRSSDSTDITTTVRNIYSHEYKCYI